MKPVGPEQIQDTHEHDHISLCVSNFKKHKQMKNYILFWLTIASFLFLSSCSDQGDCNCDNPPELRPITGGEQEVIASANDFAFDIFNRININYPDNNLFISPLSISTALSMTVNGAVGTTKDGMKEALHLGDLTDEEMNQAYKTLIEFITELDPKVTMSLANSNWYKQELSIGKSFRSILEEYYGAEVNPADFSDPSTKDLINSWIEDKTNGKIKDMLDKIPSDAVMYLINAIYLKATWQYQFEKDKTEKMDFHLSDGTKVKTDMMFSEGVKVSRYANNELQYIEIPYGNGQFVFSIIMPNEHSKLDEVIGDLNMNQLDEFISHSDTTSLQVYFPKFKIQFKLLLNDVLSSMGMEQSFGTDADFSDLFDEQLNLAISRVIHQSFIEVDEEGTEAAAATIVEIVETSIDPNGTPSVINIDRPFAFLIREKHSNSILFSGKMIDPTL